MKTRRIKVIFAALAVMAVATVAAAVRVSAPLPPLGRACNPHEVRPAAIPGGTSWEVCGIRYDEGAREGYSPADDPSVNDSVRAAQGAENAGCAVHIFHTGANFFGQIIDPATGIPTLSATELIKLQRIKDEVIDDVSVAPPPGPPEPPPEPC